MSATFAFLHHLLAFAELLLHRSCGVMDALAFEAKVVRHVKLAVAGAGGKDHRACADPLSIGQADAERLPG